MNAPSSRFRPQMRGFTLIELLTVIAIIGILAAIIIPTVGKVRQSARKSQCLSNLRQWGTAARLFSNDHKGLVALYNNLGASTPGNDPKIYSRYFGQATMVDPSGAARPSQEVMSRCPVAITNNTDPEFRARCYAFVRGGGVSGPGMKRLDSSTFGLAPGTLIPCYNIGDAVSPSQYAMMIETHSPSNSAITVDNPDAGYTMHVRPMQINSNESLVRHSGSTHIVFLDGHVASFSSGQTDYAVAANKPMMDLWFKLK